MELNTIAKICKYKKFHEGHHFISMAMEVYGAPEWDIDRFIRECACFFHDRCLGGHLFLSFCIQVFKQLVNIVFQHVLASTIKRNTALASDACSQPPITIRSHNLHASDIKEAMGEIASYHERGTSSLFFLVHVVCASFGLSLAFPFCLLFDGSVHQFYWTFVLPYPYPLVSGSKKRETPTAHQNSEPVSALQLSDFHKETLNF
jgi:hypothetical protein